MGERQREGWRADEGFREKTIALGLTMKATVFLGGGRITGALAAGLRLRGDERRIVVYDRHPEKIRELKRESRIEPVRDLKSAVACAGMLVVAVRPPSVREILQQVAGCGADPPRLCVSLAAGIPIKNLGRWLKPPVGWVRAMPSPVCRTGKGFTPVSYDRSVPKSERAQVRQIFEQVGPVVELPESLLDLITASSSPTHGYHALAALAKTAQDGGLDPKTALLAAAHALGDGIAYWRQSGLRLPELLDEAATPGGIAAATMAAMDKAGYGRAVDRGIRAGVKQCRRNRRF
jgi:pyrroline-5-carboxylate reductase